PIRRIGARLNESLERILQPTAALSNDADLDDPVDARIESGHLEVDQGERASAIGKSQGGPGGGGTSRGEDEGGEDAGRITEDGSSLTVPLGPSSKAQGRPGPRRPQGINCHAKIDRGPKAKRSPVFRYRPFHLPFRSRCQLTDVLCARVLVLNRHFQPVQLTT